MESNIAKTNLTGLDIQNVLPQFGSWLSMSRDARPLTILNHTVRLRVIARYLNENEFTKDNCLSFLTEKKLTLSAGSIATYVRTIRAFGYFLMETKGNSENFGMEIRMPKRESKPPPILSITEIETLINTDISLSYSHYPNPRQAKLVFDTTVRLLATTGCRLSEMLSMKVSDVDWTSGKWTLMHSKTRKGRLIPLHEDLLFTMKNFTDGRSVNDFVFLNPQTGTVMRNHHIQHNLVKRARKAGILKAVHPHVLRHSFITELLRRDVGILKIADLVGHADIKQTADYAKLLYEDLRDAIYRHPLNAKQRNAHDIKEQIKQDIEKYRLKEDTRFLCDITDGNDRLKIDIVIR